MKIKRIALISFILFLLIICIGSACADDMEEIDVDKSIATDNGINEIAEIEDNLNYEEEPAEINDVDTGIYEEEIEEDITENDLKESKLGASNLQSTIVIDGSAYNQMSNPTIQNAIDSANAGDTIIITGKDYVHCHFIIDKQLTIISNVGTKMSPCPSNTRGSGTYGIFYLSPKASGTVIQGFTLTNTIDEYDCYGILAREASDVKILNCTINTTKYGDGIRLENTTNALINNSIVKNSNIGIHIVNSTKTTITNNNISNNTVTGIYIGDNNTNTTVHTNNITYNRHTGVNMSSANYVYIINNFIAYNRNGDEYTSTSGAGVYVNCNITKIEIKGNYIRQNGMYGVLNDYRVRNMDAKRYAELLEINNNNYYIGHTERITYHIEYKKYPGGAFNYDSVNDVYVFVGEGNGEYDVDKSVVYLAYAFYIQETICGATLYAAPSTTWSSGNYQLRVSEISQVKKGIYNVSIVDKNGNIATDLSSIYVTFYLNKDNDKAEPQSGDIYRTVLMKNGTATADFSKAEFKESGNVITAVFPGLFDVYSINPYATFNVADSDIPVAYSQTKISVQNMNLVPKSGEYFTARLLDENGNPVVGETVSFKISGISGTYKRTTDSNGQAKLQINLGSSKTYTVTVSFAGDENYNKSSAKASLTIKKQTPKITSSDAKYIPKSGEYYTISLKDANGKAMSNKKVSFKISGISKTYNRTTDSNGQAKLQINLATKKTYTVTISSPATDQYYAASKTNKITIQTGAKKAKITASNANFIPQSGEYYTVKLSDEKGNGLADKKIEFKISGISKTYNRTTDSDGKAKLTINLKNEQKSSIQVIFNGDNTYAPASVNKTITIAKGSPELISYDRTINKNDPQSFSVVLKDEKGNPLANKEIKFTLPSNTYSKLTDENGLAELDLDLNAGNYSIISAFEGDSQYKAVKKTNAIAVKDEEKVTYIDAGLANDEIQRIIDESPEGNDIKFLGTDYEGINLIINKSHNISSDVNTTLNGEDGKAVFTVKGEGVKISNFNINANSKSGEGNGIVISNSKDVIIENNIIKNILDPSKTDEYNNGSTLLPGYGISILNSERVNITNNKVSSFESSLYAEYSQKFGIYENELTLSNYGIKYGFNNANTKIENNVIIDNVGWYVMDVPEGPRGYGIFLNNSAVNISISQNNISNNYMGISIDANNSTGIIITSNLIADNSLEGIRFNAGYDLAENVVEPVITDNAIYRNAEGPSMMILGEMSANPAGIYGPGEFDEELRLKIDPNWYGVNALRTWDWESGIVGVGTMCPRIKTTTIKFPEIVCTSPGTYTISFYKDGVLDSNLASFDIYATLNRKTDKKTEVHFLVVNGTGTFTFDKMNYLDEDNVIEISVGSLINVVDRLYTVVYTHNVTEAEIPV